MQEISNQELELNSSMINKIKPYILPALAVIGILLSIELTIVYFNANFISGAKPSFCAISEAIDCDAVARTQFSHFLGVPLSLWGLSLYSFILFLNFLPSLNNAILKDLKNSKSYIFTIASISLIISLILAKISSTEIHKVCLLCVISYFLNFCILIASKNDESVITHYKNTLKDAYLFVSSRTNSLFLFILVAITSITLYYFNTSGIFVNKNPFSDFTKHSSKYTTNGNILGAKKPKLTIHEYTDFQCSYCAISNAMMERLVQEIKSVQVVHHDFPLNKKCNPVIKKSIHENSCTAALYSRAAKEQGKYWELNSKLFDNQQNLSETKILQLAKNLGLNTDKLKKDANNPEAKNQLISDTKKANNMGITATPTLFIGMKKYEGLMPYPELKKIVLNNMK
ncbi:MAG: thioredoxin domain-containing protein [Candidatus Gastranaerophilales bacterium]|nr:thioredoxin domain-containing protein [Candidatus Gastranaerophilales bacterium]